MEIREWSRASALGFMCLVFAAGGSVGCSSSGASSQSAAGSGAVDNFGGSSNDGAGANGLGGSIGAGGSNGVSGFGGTSIDPGTQTEQVTVKYSWSTWEVSGTTVKAVTCADYSLDTVTSVIDDGNGNRYPVMETNNADCASGTGGADWAFVPGTLSLTVSLSRSTPPVFTWLGASETFTLPAGVTSFTVPEFKIYFANYAPAWTLTKAGASATCADVGAQNVGFTLTRYTDGGSAATTWTEACSAGSSGIPPLTPATYDLTADLLSPGGIKLASWQAIGGLVVSATSATVLQPFEFTLP